MWLQPVTDEEYTSAVYATKSGYDNHALSAREQAIVAIASYTGKGDLEHLPTALTKGLEVSMTINEIKEVLIQAYAYCGFPRALNGLATVDEVLSERQSKNIHDTMGNDATPLPANTDILALGTRVQTQLAGAPVNIASMNGTESQLLSHLNIGINAGLSKTQLQDIINTLDAKVNTQLAQHAQENLNNYLASSK